MPRPLVATVPAPTGGGLRPRRSPCQPASRAQVPAPLPTSGLPALRVPGDQPLEIVCLKAETLATRGMSPNWPQVTGGFGPPSQLEAYERSPGPPEQLRDLQRGVISPLARYPSQGTAIWTWHTAPGQYEDNPRPPWGRGTNEFQRQRKRPTDRQTPQGRGKRSRLEEGKEQREKSQGFRAFFVGL
ncbi:uncharacterized protein Dll4l1 isoform X2 [Rattus norvegicus]|uniref:uncharacterized protein Dll4l1 isoform X2 n=1 Tax=Rattus norvegicus TaxID=10116 RepID=UPI001917669F|nr:uncharacterized protein LOC103691871 isoform X2 [Rattus norvegicus]